MQETTSSNREIFVFGPYRLSVAERLLEREGAPVHLGSRALDLLIALVEEAGAVLSKRDLMKRVWGDT
jgi:DNA-binding winged helix-turn-helix (wHTH) protein